MVNDSDEDEIKIEYFAAFEIDPLSENYTASHSKFTQKHEERSKVCQIPSIQLNSLENDNIECGDDGCTDYEDDSKVSLEDETSWYESIDNEGRYLCKFCKLKYSTIQTLRYHVKTKHTDAAISLRKAVLKKKRKNKLKCHICNQYFKILSELKQHVISNHSIENINCSCTYCDAAFCSNGEMLLHLQNHHSKIKLPMHICSICGYRTAKKSHYKQHQNTHKTTKDIKCNYCDYSTNYLPNLRSHERIHTNDKPYVCSYDGCDYRCSAKSGLRSHQLKHYPEVNMVYCDKCSYKTVYKQSLKKHMDSHKRNSIKAKFL